MDQPSTPQPLAGFSNNEELLKALRSRATSYPTDDDAAFAQRYNYGYENGFEPFNQGQRARAAMQPRGDVDKILQALRGDQGYTVAPDMKQEVANTYTKAALAANRSPITALGYDPHKFSVDFGAEPTNLGGVYSPSQDYAYTNPAMQDAIVHESTHRGIELLRNSGRLTPAEVQWLASSKNDEMLTRHLMQRYMGVQVPQVPRIEGDRLEQAAQRQFQDNPDLATMIEGLERKAQDYKAARRPGGPR